MARGTAALGALTIALLWLGGCGNHYFNRYRAEIAQNQQALQHLQLGMSASDVRRLMGQGERVRYRRIYLVDPWRSEAFALADGSQVLLLYYVTQPPRKYYSPQDHELTPIVLENDGVVGWGWSYLRQNNDRYPIPSPREQR